MFNEETLFEMKLGDNPVVSAKMTTEKPKLTNYTWAAIWTATRKGDTVVYEYSGTYAGAPGPVTYRLPLEAFGQVQRIEQKWNDATSKDFSVRIVSAPADTLYTELWALTGDLATSKVLQLGDSYDYPLGARLDFVYTNYTNAKTFKIVVAVKY